MEQNRARLPEKDAFIMILLIDKSKKDAMTYSEIFHYMGVLSYAVPIKAGEKIPNDAKGKYRAAVVIGPEGFDDPDTLPERIRRNTTDIPVFALSDEPANARANQSFDGVMPKNVFSSRLLEGLQDFARAHGMTPPGVYKLAGIDASCDTTPLYFGDPIGLTKTEAMILRVLILYYPLSVPPKQIMKYAYRPSRMPELSNIRTHVSAINRKFRALAGRNLIMPATEQGYTVLTPERMEEEKKPALVGE